MLGSSSAEILEAQKSVHGLGTEESIVVDGFLDEASWLLAEPATDFIQAEPTQGEPSTERTEVRILFDSENLYFGVTCLDSDPGGIVGNSMRRDFRPGYEDSFEIVLDTFADFRSGFLFVTNPKGAKRDVQVSNDGREQNASWDVIWDVKTRINQEGWIAEIRIPIKSLRYDRSHENVWNVNFGRRIRRKNETIYWSEIPRQYQISRVSLAGRLLGVGEADWSPGRNLQVIPYVVTNIVDNPEGTSTSADVGGDIKYGLTSGLTLDLTVNTDFSHVEVDRQQVNLERFSLFFQEKRDFFLENSGMFDIGGVPSRGGRKDEEDVVVFHSRRIGLSENRRPVPLIGGARLTGRASAYQLGLMSVQTDEAVDQGQENASVFRVRRDTFARSWVGAFFLNRQGPERPTNRVYGLDGTYRPNTDWVFNGLFAQSQSPGISEDDWTMRMQGEFNRPWLWVNLVHTNVQENYRDDLGFTPRPHMHVTRFETVGKVRPWEGKLIREIRPQYRVRYLENFELGALGLRKLTLGLDFEFRNSSLLRFRRTARFERLGEAFEVRDGIEVAAGDYNYTEWFLDWITDRSRILSADVHWIGGDFWDGRKTTVRFGIQFRPSAHLTTQISFSRDNVSLPTGKFKADLSGFRFNYAFNTQTFLDTFIQYNSEKQLLTSNIRFNLIHHLLSDLFVVYTEGRPTAGDIGTDRLISLKYTHLLTF